MSIYYYQRLLRLWSHFYFASTFATRLYQALKWLHQLRWQEMANQFENWYNFSSDETLNQSRGGHWTKTIAKKMQTKCQKILLRKWNLGKTNLSSRGVEAMRAMRFKTSHWTSRLQSTFIFLFVFFILPYTWLLSILAHHFSPVSLVFGSVLLAQGHLWPISPIRDKQQKE